MLFYSCYNRSQFSKTARRFCGCCCSSPYERRARCNSLPLQVISPGHMFEVGFPGFALPISSPWYVSRSHPSLSKSGFVGSGLRGSLSRLANMVAAILPYWVPIVATWRLRWPGATGVDDPGLAPSPPSVGRTCPMPGVCWQSIRDICPVSISQGVSSR